MRILLAVDGSDNSYEAAQALKFLGRTEAITLLHVLDVPTPAYPMTAPEVRHEYYEMERTMRADGERLLDRILSLLPTEKGSVTKRLETGSPCDTIVTCCEEQGIDLVVLGARRLGPVLERLIGSCSHRVLTLAHCGHLGSGMSIDLLWSGAGRAAHEPLHFPTCSSKVGAWLIDSFPLSEHVGIG